MLRERHVGRAKEKRARGREKTGRGEDGGGCSQVMHGRSRMTTGGEGGVLDTTHDPCIPTWYVQCPDGTRGAFTDQADIACTKREAKT